MSLLEINNISISFVGLKAIDSLSFSVDEGSTVGLIGPNGAGKTTVFNCIARYFKPDQGQILFRGEDLLAFKPHEVIEKGIARTFQNMELFRSMTVQDNLLVGQHSRVNTGFFINAFSLRKKKINESQIKDKAAAVMDRFGLTPYANSRVISLPYGIQKKVEFARALVSEPKLILLDEPAAGMNPNETEEITELIKQLRSVDGITVLLVEHDMKLVRSICDEINVIDFGRKIAHGTPEEISRNPQVIEAYLGRQEENEYARA
ncbi:ABC transporter ATP-binding protein [Neobacillus rhizophilus]|uniref:ABC transporter ATP-binding protein n=1 Tax=Neobacillus rhizophilus TaxID=2833579 RepID=A0A942UB72_9BACI|nr:ABC transporter ATP-binding protein [Neobacillus rhizophilus]MBS4214954.1 ABC transporter ATP-binding protein [Neobacillus rhizophilus]